jgi:hypothetical protein
MGKNPHYKSFDDCPVVREPIPCSIECPDWNWCNGERLTIHHLIGKEAVKQAYEEWGADEARIVSKYRKDHSNIVLARWCAHKILNRVMIRDLDHLPPLEVMQRIVDGDEGMRRPENPPRPETPSLEDGGF